MTNIAIEVKEVSLKYKFIKNMNIKQELVNLIFKGSINNRINETWALKNINLKIEKGRTIGIIGPNGAGKSTLLKVIGGIYKPELGEIKLNSESISLLTLGAGFQPELSGVDNIYLNGLLLGLTKQEIDKKLNEIIEFSELKEFIYQPVKTYSSGMRARLGFSISCNIEPDVLLIDEVLGVGDEAFKEKSSSRMKELISRDRTVIIVSHSLTTIKELCDSVLWLNKGEVMAFGNSDEVIMQYKEFMKNAR